MQEWYYQVMGEQRGPVSSQELKRLADRGDIARDYLVRRATDENWHFAEEVRGLFAQTRSSPPAPVIADEPPAPPVLKRQLPRPLPRVAKSNGNLEAGIAQKSSMVREKKVAIGIGCAIVFVIIGAALVAVVSGTSPSINPIQSIRNASLQSVVNGVVEGDERNRGIEVSAYYTGTLGTSSIAFSVNEVQGANSRLDVFRMFLDFAEQMQDKSFQSVELACKGETRFKIDGEFFKTLGEERDFQNPAFTIRTFPEHLETPSGQRAYGQWEGGLLAVLSKQMEDFNDFHDKWYGDALELRFASSNQTDNSVADVDVATPLSDWRTNPPLSIELVRDRRSGDHVVVDVKITNISTYDVRNAEVACVFLDDAGDEVAFAKHYVIYSADGLAAGQSTHFDYVVSDVPPYSSIHFQIESLEAESDLKNSQPGKLTGKKHEQFAIYYPGFEKIKLGMTVAEVEQILELPELEKDFSFRHSAQINLNNDKFYKTATLYFATENKKLYEVFFSSYSEPALDTRANIRNFLEQNYPLKFDRNDVFREGQYVVQVSRSAAG